MIKPELIGTVFSVNAPNGLRINITIKNDPNEFELYRRLGLDVFAEIKKAKVDEVFPAKEVVVKDKKPKGATPKK